jgi:hypothetical protein
MDSVPGQTFLNYAYSWGASVVILGTLFKLTHLPGANFFLFLGMGTEVFVFFISAFDRPFDKTADGRDLPTHLEEEETVMNAPAGGTIIAGVSGTGSALSSTYVNNVPNDNNVPNVNNVNNDNNENNVNNVPNVPNATGASGGTIIIGGGGAVSGTAVAGGGAIGGAMANSGAAFIAQQEETTPELADAQTNYVEELQKLTETLSQMTEQNQRLISDSAELENLNRTITGITRIYEMQLKSASSQMGTIDEINDQSRHLAQQIAELNRIYTRMIEAMTVNMPGAGASLDNK